MLSLTLEELYYLITNYLIKGYCLQFNRTWVNTHSDCQRRYLCLMHYANDVSLYWDDPSTNTDIPRSWDHETIIEKWI